MFQFFMMVIMIQGKNAVVKMKLNTSYPSIRKINDRRIKHLPSISRSVKLEAML